MTPPLSPSDNCLQTLTFAPALTQTQWCLLKDAVLYARLNTVTPDIGFSQLPLPLQQHPIGLLINRFLTQHDEQALESAARQLLPNETDYWLALMKT